jgi:hypothetical protein
MSARTPIFVVSEDGKLLTRMNPAAPEKEDVLQELIATHPDLICGEDEKLLLVAREQGIADAVDGSPRWSVDHLFVNGVGEPVLVEVKRAVDTRLRREVVGQMLDYAANAVAYWSAGSIGNTFESTCKKDGKNPEEALGEFLGPDGLKSDEFWAKVEENMQAGKLKLLFVADEIPTELARIVEFMNDHMDLSVSAVELRYFEGNAGEKTLSPRIIGETERAKLRKNVVARQKLPPIRLDDWLDKFIKPMGEAAMTGAQALIRIFEKCDAIHDVASTQGSIVCWVKTDEGKSAYPFLLTKLGRCQIGFGWTTLVKSMESEESRRAWYVRFAEAVGGLSNENFISGFPWFTLDKLADNACLAKFEPVAKEFLMECRK